MIPNVRPARVIYSSFSARSTNRSIHHFSIPGSQFYVLHFLFFSIPPSHTHTHTQTRNPSGGGGQGPAYIDLPGHNFFLKGNQKTLRRVSHPHKTIGGQRNQQLCIALIEKYRKEAKNQNCNKMHKRTTFYLCVGVDWIVTPA